MQIQYTKMTGSGNDFILVNNMDLRYNIEEIRPFIPKICARGISVGADGFIMLEPAEGADFKWHFYNADGSEAEMCGNGSRCAARFAHALGIAGKHVTFHTAAGLIHAEIKEGANVKVQLTEPHGMVLDKTAPLAEGYDTYSFVNTGVPHAVLFVDRLERLNVTELGRILRHHDEFAPAGTNVNFVNALDKQTLYVRTYERGVEAETLACGTGAVASVIIASAKGLVTSPVTVHTQGQIDMIVSIEDGKVFLEGEARLLAEGTLQEESMTY